MCVYKEHCLTISIRKERESVCVRHSGWLLIPGDNACVSLTRQQSKVRNTEAGKLAQRGEGRHTGIRHHCPGMEELSVDSSRPRKGLATQPRAARNRRPLNWPPHSRLKWATEAKAAHPHSRRATLTSVSQRNSLENGPLTTWDTNMLSVTCPTVLSP